MKNWSIFIRAATILSTNSSPEQRVKGALTDLLINGLCASWLSAPICSVNIIPKYIFILHTSHLLLTCPTNCNLFPVLRGLQENFHACFHCKRKVSFQKFMQSNLTAVICRLVKGKAKQDEEEGWKDHPWRSHYPDNA